MTLVRSLSCPLLFHVLSAAAPIANKVLCFPLNFTNQLFIKSPMDSGTLLKLNVQLTILQQNLATGHVKNKWSMVSLDPQKDPLHPLLTRLTLVKILFLPINHMKILTFQFFFLNFP